MQSMAQRIAELRLLILLTLLSPSAWATYLVGGNIKLVSKGTAGQYTLSLSEFVDEQNGQQGGARASVTLTIYRRDNNNPLKMGSFELPFVSQKALPVSNQICAQLRPLQLAEVLYSRDITLDPDRYNDPNGYVVVYGVCCRSAIIDNITQPEDAGIVFHLEFPALKATPNSSPVFSAPTGEYACKGQPFSLNFNATDADGDQLVYSLVTPYKGFTSQGNTPDNTYSSAYPTIQWKAGFSATNAVPGAPALLIDPTTGQLTVTASQTGMFVFTVLCEEYRAGVRIGSVRRDFQLAVVDCPKDAPPTPVIALVKAPAEAKVVKNADGSLASVLICPDKSVTLHTDSTAQWAFQWQRDGADLPGDTAASLTVRQTGSYTVIKRIRNTCGQSSPAQASVRVEVAPGENLKLTNRQPTAFCQGGSVTLEAPAGAYAYQWFKNNQVINSTSSSLEVKESGQYRVQITSTATGCVSLDTAVVRVKPLPSVIVAATSATNLCEGDSVPLRATSQPSYQYQWMRNGSPVGGATGALFIATQSGQYTVTVTDTNQCSATAPATDIHLRTAPVVTLDPIPSVCEGMTTVIPLMAQPTGGAFAGQGKAAGAVTGNEFNPAKVGAGQYVITYTLSGSGSTCPGRARQTVVVYAAPTVAVRDVSVSRGGTVMLNEKGADTLRYQWSPPDGLSDPTAARPLASPDQTTTYRLTATSSQGCERQAQLTVAVVNPVYIPDAFTPNGDGTNDVWELRGLSEYPNCSVEIFNRWGNCVFASKGYPQPWDGKRNGEDLAPATYQYVIKLGDSELIKSGSVLLVR